MIAFWYRKHHFVMTARVWRRGIILHMTWLVFKFLNMNLGSLFLDATLSE